MGALRGFRASKTLIKVGMPISMRIAGAQSCDGTVLGELYLLFDEAQSVATDVARQLESKQSFSAIYAAGERNIAAAARAMAEAARQGQLAYPDGVDSRSCDPAEVLRAAIGVDAAMTAATQYA